MSTLLTRITAFGGRAKDAVTGLLDPRTDIDPDGRNTFRPDPGWIGGYEYGGVVIGQPYDDMEDLYAAHGHIDAEQFMLAVRAELAARGEFEGEDYRPMRAADVHYDWVHGTREISHPDDQGPDPEPDIVFCSRDSRYATPVTYLELERVR